MDLLVCELGSAVKGGIVAALNGFLMKFFRLQEFTDGSSECLFEGDFEHNLMVKFSQIKFASFAQMRTKNFERIFLFYEFKLPMELHAFRVLRLIRFLRKFCQDLVLIAPFMPFLREHSEDFRTNSWQLLDNIPVITLDPHILRENVFAVGSSFFESEILPEDLVILPDAGASRYRSQYKNEFISATKDRAIGIKFSDGERIFGRNCVILDDIISSGYTLRATVQALQKYNPANIKACVTHNLYENPDPKAWGLDSLAISDTLIVGKECNKIFDYARAFTNLRSIVDIA